MAVAAAAASVTRVYVRLSLDVTSPLGDVRLKPYGTQTKGRLHRDSSSDMNKNFDKSNKIQGRLHQFLYYVCFALGELLLLYSISPRGLFPSGIRQFLGK